MIQRTYLLSCQTWLQIAKTEADSTGAVVVTTDLPFVTGKSRITTGPAPYLVDTGDFISGGATRLREMDVRDGNGGLARVTTPIVAALLGVGAFTVAGALVFADASGICSNSWARVEYFPVSICMVGKSVKQREKDQ